ncbi:MAG: outer membrane beta-barrel protein [Alphaproteobacteria bacterium]|nr:outer membrane beta-barrel protein [Alphaproteobacteria bacterium]
MKSYASERNIRGLCMNKILAAASTLLLMVSGSAFAQNYPAQGGPQNYPPQNYPAQGYPGPVSGPPNYGRVIPQAKMTDFSGARAQIQVDWSSLSAPGNGGYCDIYGNCYSNSVQLGSNFNAGGEIGYDMPVSSHVTVGPYARYETPFGAASGCMTCAGDNYSLGLRAGFVASRRFLVYGKVGYNRMKSNINYSYIDATGATQYANANYNYAGAEFGIGLNYLLSHKYYAGVELMDHSYGNGDPYYGGDQRFDIGLTLGTHF